MKHSYRSLLFTVLGFLVFIPVFAQQYSFYYPETNKQLPQQFVYSLTADSLGYLWIATGEGIVKYDGNRLFPIQVNKKPSRNFCTTLNRIDNKMYVGFYDGSLAIGFGDNLTLFPASANGKIVAVSRCGDNLYVCTQSEVYRLEKSTLVLVKKIPQGEVICGMSTPDSKNLLLAGSFGLHKFNPLTKKQVSLSNEPFFGVSTNGITTVGVSMNAVYVVYANTIRQIYQLESGQFNPENVPVISGKNIYLACDNKLIELGPKGNRIFSVGEEGFSVKAIHAENGQLWLGTYGNGICYFNPSCYSYYENSKQALGTIGLVATEKYLIEARTSSVILYPISVNGTPQFPAQKTISLTETISGIFKTDKGIFIGTQQGKVLKLEGEKVIPDKLFNKGLPAKPVLSISQKGQDVYISIAQNGVFHFSADGNLLENLNTSNGLLHNDILKVFSDSQNRTWFISQSSGLSYREKGEFKYLTLKDGLGSLEFTDITEDQNQSIWLSTEGGGLTKMTASSIENYNLSSGLSSDYYYGLSHQNDRLYSYSRGGINILVNNQLRKIESAEIGIVPNFQPRAIAVGKNYVAVGSEYGPIIHYLEQVFPVNAVKLVVKQALVNDSKLLENQGNLNYNDYKIEFNIEQINLNPFFQPSIEFKLMGFDKDWQTLEKSNVIYQSVKDNHYVFVVRDKQFTGNHYDFTFNVEKPFWKKPLYYALFSILAIAGVYLIIRIRIKQLKQRNKELEEKVADRTTELRRKNTELEQFIFAMSHDLKNPAVNMVELANLMKDVLGSNPDMAKEVANQLTTVSGKMLNNLLELIDLLKFANSKELPKENVSILELIETIKASISKSIEEANAEFIIDLTPFDHLHFNRSNLQSVLYNLISNAVKYRKQGQNAVVEIRSLLIDVKPAIMVKDNGMGMDLEANKDRLFGIFQRMHHHVEGTGIGLHLVKSIMEKHGGTVEVISQPGVGTTFTLIFASLR